MKNLKTRTGPLLPTLMLLALMLLALSYQACRKLEPEPDANPNRSARTDASTLSAPFDPNADSIERATVLGVQLPNPYTLANMRTAYQNITGSSAGVVATHQYVRFKPTLAQIETLEDLDLELLDTPLDYQIISERDYYQDPAIPVEEVTWQYSVVPVGFAFPSGVAYENLATIHIPSNLTVEAEAERLAGLNADGDGLASGGVAPRSVIPGGIGDGPTSQTPLCPPRECWECMPDVACACVPCTLTPPPPPAPVARPRIVLTDTRLTGVQGLRKTRVVVRRWFKIDRVFTNNNGDFALTKQFRKKVRINVKFKNEDAIVRRVRAWRLWQMLFPLKFNVGEFNISDINRELHVFTRGNVGNSKQTQFWVAATTHNAVQEMRGFATQQGIGLPPGRTKIMLTNWGQRLGGSGAAPMFAKRYVNTLPVDFIRTLVLGYLNPGVGLISSVVNILKGQIDIMYNYNVENINNLDSDDVCETIYHELCHAAHYQKLGNGWYADFVNATLAEMALAVFDRPASPYGRGNTVHSPIIAVGEAWAYHMGRVLADQRYGTTASQQVIQNGAFRVGNGGGVGAHIGALESFDPNLAGDVFRWIPKGIMLDLSDNTPTEAIGNRANADQVTGYTNQQFFNALDADVRSVPNFRLRLLQENNNSQQVQVTALFQVYGY